MEFSRPEYWSRLPCPPPWDLPNPEIKPRSPTLQVDSSPSEPPGKPIKWSSALNYSQLWKKIRSGLFIFQQASIKWKGKTCLIKIKTHFDCHSFKDISLVNFVSEANSSLSLRGSLNWSPRTPRIGRGHGMKLHVWSKRTDERREKTHVSQLIIA